MATSVCISHLSEIQTFRVLRLTLDKGVNYRGSQEEEEENKRSKNLRVPIKYYLMIINHPLQVWREKEGERQRDIKLKEKFAALENSAATWLKYEEKEKLKVEE